MSFDTVIPIEDETILILPKENYSFGIPSRLAIYSLYNVFYLQVACELRSRVQLQMNHGVISKTFLNTNNLKIEILVI